MSHTAKNTAISLGVALALAGCGNEISVVHHCSETWYQDADGDGYGNFEVTADADPDKNCQFPAGWVENPDDCNDNDATVHPETIWYADLDWDGYGDPTNSKVGCSPGVDWVQDSGDCDDDNPELTPETEWFADDDGDGFGDADAIALACVAPAGHVAKIGDCDDADPDIHPDATEVCDGIDNDCDNQIDSDDLSLDPATSTAHHPDADGDGYGTDFNVLYTCDTNHPPGHVGNGGDCDDSNDQVHPGAQEVCFTDDDDCDGLVDDADPSVAASATFYPDADRDGFGDPNSPVLACVQPAGLLVDATDCDDTSAQTFPGAAPNDHPTACMVDLDLDDYGDVAAPAGVTPGTDCDDSNAQTFPGAAPNDSTYLCMNDDDNDDWGDATAGGLILAGTDCNDLQAAVSPGANERCTTVYDDNCDGRINDSSAVDVVTVWYDVDGDGYGRGAALRTCVAPPGTASRDGDCADTNSAIYPGAPEYCNGADDDCDTVPDNDAVDASGWFEDLDGDGHGSSVAAVTACTNPDPSRYSSDGTDCDDSNDSVFPGAPEFCDGIQNDCNIAGWTDAAEDGLVSVESRTGAWSDATTLYDWTDPTVPSGFSIGSGGTVWFCRGDFYGRLVASNPITLTIEGRHGAAETRIHGSPLSGAIELNAPGTAATIRGLSILDSGAPYGAGIEAREGSLVVDACEFHGNDATQSGGAILADMLSTFTVDDSVFADNTSGAHGGAIWLINGTQAVIRNSTFVRNAALELGRTGGAVHAQSGATWTVSNSFFEQNSAQHGGALAAETTAGAGNTTQSCMFLDNRATTEGGAVRSMTRYTDIGSTFDGNTATEGGGLAVINGATNSLSATEFIGNTATRGGAIRTEGSGASSILDLDSVQLLDNQATGWGGAVSVLNAHASLTTVDVLRNSAPIGAGSGIHLEGSTAQVVNSDLGVGVDDNQNSDDVYVLEAATSFAFDAAATFFCDTLGC